MKNTNSISRNLLLFIIFTSLTIFIWVGIEIYHSLRKTALPEIMLQHTEPFNPDLNTKSINLLKKRKAIDQNQINSTPEITLFEAEKKGATPSASNL